MADDEDLKKRFAARYKRNFGSAKPAAILEKVRAIIGTEHLPEGPDSETALAALAALKDGTSDVPTPEQFSALERMIRMVRPAPLVKDGKPGDLRPEFKSIFPDWKEFRSTFHQFASSVGRIEKPGDDGIGTGFLVSASTVVTNHHVLDDLTAGTGVLGAGQAFINFGVEFQSSTFEAPIPIVKVKAIHSTADIVLLEIDPNPADSRKPLPLSAALPAVEDQVVAIGYPFDDQVNNPAFTGVIFGGKFGVKRAAPGEVVKVSKERETVAHDCSTLGGNSGSPLVSIKTCQVVGVHFGGRFLWRNEAVHCLTLGKFLKDNGD